MGDNLKGGASAPPVPPYAKPGPYITQLAPDQETKFQQWVQQNHVPFNPSPTSDYDMRGYYKALQSGDPNAKQQLSGYDGTMHFPDTYKTPYHKTFSNESQYATPNAPHWEGNRLVNSGGQVLSDETPKGGAAVHPEPDWDDNDYKAHGMTPPSHTDKKVHVPGHGLLSFPRDIPDAHIGSAIQQHLAANATTQVASAAPAPMAKVSADLPSRGHEASPYSVNDAPQFIRNGLPMDQVSVTPGDPNALKGQSYGGRTELTQSYVDPREPYKVRVMQPQNFTQNILDHELAHAYMDRLESQGVKFAPTNQQDPYGYGDVNSLAGKKATDFSQEQLGRMVQDHTGRWKMMQSMASQGLLQQSDVDSFNKWQGAVGPIVHSLATLGQGSQQYAAPTAPAGMLVNLPEFGGQTIKLPNTQPTAPVTTGGVKPAGF